jgi:hypothetical protein
MRNLIIKIIFLGLLFGFIGTTMTMLFSLSVYFTITLLDLFVFPSFLEYAGFIAIGVGLICCFVWYCYILWMAREFFIRIFEKLKPR